MTPCKQEDNIKELRVMITELKISDARKEVQISTLINSVGNLIGWIKVFVGIIGPSMLVLIGFLIHFWVKG